MPRDPSTMYRWRRLTPEQRIEVLDERKRHRRPQHSVPHFASDLTSYYMVTAACYEHTSVIGLQPSRMVYFEDTLVDLLNEVCNQVFAWVILPNHYHTLVDAPNIKQLLAALGKLHGRTSFEWNGEENCRGRQVWCNAAETAMKSERHYYASLNYVLHNAVHHGYVTKWTDWPYSNAGGYLQSLGREKALRIWNSYPLFEYGQSWDPPEL